MRVSLVLRCIRRAEVKLISMSRRLVSDDDWDLDDDLPVLKVFEA